MGGAHTKQLCVWADLFAPPHAEGAGLNENAQNAENQRSPNIVVGLSAIKLIVDETGLDYH